MLGNFDDVPLISYSTGSEMDIIEGVLDFIKLGSSITRDLFIDDEIKTLRDKTSNAMSRYP